VDVRDIADLHYRAMLAEGIAGERFIGANDFWWMGQVAEVLKRRLGDKARKVPTMKVPNFAIRLMANFDPVVKDRLFELDKHRPVSNAKAKRVLGWAPRGNEEAVVAAAESMIQEGVV
jgi:dihydroflavonol-4-reductase